MGFETSVGHLREHRRDTGFDGLREQMQREMHGFGVRLMLREKNAAILDMLDKKEME